MGFGTILKGNKALRLQRKGEKEEALRLYEEAIAEGLNDAHYLMPYALLLVRDEQYQKAKDFLVAHQKAPGMQPQQRMELMVYYATCCLRLGNVDKGISVLEQQARKGETGLVYQTLGFLYVEKYDLKNRPDFAALAAARAEEAKEETAAETEEAAEAPADGAEETAEAEAPAEPALSPEEEWNAGIEKARAFIEKSLEYDDEDPICLDNMGQFVYRVLGDRAAAREWFDKAIRLKDTQIDTLYFLSRYDEEAGDTENAVKKLEKAAEGRFSPLNYCTREMTAKEIARLKGDA